MKNDKLLEILIYLTVFFIPLYLIRVKIWFIPTNILEIIIILIALAVIFSKSRKFNLKKFFFEYGKYIYITIFILISFMLSALFNGNSQESWGIIKSWFLVPIILLLLCGEIIKKEKIKNVFWAYFFSSAVLAIVSVGYFALGKMTYDGRLASIFNSPNYLAMYLSPAVVIFLFQEIKNKIKLIPLFLIILLAIYLTYSYAAWLAIILAILLVSFYKNRSNFGKVFYFQILFILLLVFIIFSFQIDKNKFINVATLNERSSVASRIMIWKASFKMIENNFWLGIGAGNFQKVYLEYQKFYPPYLNWAVSHPNNLYLTWWLYGGVFGLVGFFTLIVNFFLDVFKKTEPKEVLFVALGIMLVVLIHGIFDATYFKNDLAIIFWLNFLVLKKRN